MWIWLTIVLLLCAAFVGFIVYHVFKIKSLKKECPKCPKVECPKHECPKQECPIKVGLTLSSPNEKSRQLWEALQTKLSNMQQIGCIQIKNELIKHKDAMIEELESLKDTNGNNIMPCDTTVNIVRSMGDYVKEETQLPTDVSFYISEITNFVADAIKLVCKDGYVDANEVIALIRGVVASLCPGDVPI